MSSFLEAVRLVENIPNQKYNLTQEDKAMPNILLEPPTPLETNIALRFNQGILPSSISSASLPGARPPSPGTGLPDSVFAWQESLNLSSSNVSRPTSVSGWSTSGTSVSGDDSFHSAVSSSNSLNSSPSQSGKSKSHARKKAPGHVNRPRNAFILFRSHAISNNIIPPALGVKDNRAVSCIVASLWKSLPEDERQQWKSEAEREKELHRLRYPDYQFKPGNCGTKGKTRKHAKTEEAVREQCEIIADQILRAHGRAPSIEEEEAKKKKEIAAAKRASKKKDALPRARKAANFNSKEVKKELEVDKRVKTELAPEAEGDSDSKNYAAPLHTVSRRRSSSLPFHGLEPSHPYTLSKRTQAASEHSASWEANLPQYKGEGGQISTERGGFAFPQTSFSANRRGVNPASLSFALPNAFAEVNSFGIPASPLTSMTPTSPTPRHSTFNLFDRQRSTPLTSRFQAADILDGSESMLLSPDQSSFYNARKDSTAWQSWSRYTFADVALPVMKPRHSIDSAVFQASSRRNSILHQPQRYHEDRDDVFSQTAQSFHHNLVSPTLQTYSQYNGAYKGETQGDLFEFVDASHDEEEGSEVDQLASEQDDDDDIEDAKEYSVDDLDEEMFDVSSSTDESLRPVSNLNHLSLHESV